jgi:hypothetical protein
MLRKWIGEQFVRVGKWMMYSHESTEPIIVDNQPIQPTLSHKGRKMVYEAEFLKDNVSDEREPTLEGSLRSRFGKG